MQQIVVKIYLDKKRKIQLVDDWLVGLNITVSNTYPKTYQNTFESCINRYATQIILQRGKN